MEAGFFKPSGRRAGGRGRSSHGATSQITSRSDRGGTQAGRLQRAHNPGPEHLMLLNKHQPILAVHSFTASDLILMLSLFHLFHVAKTPELIVRVQDQNSKNLLKNKVFNSCINSYTWVSM